MCNWTQNLNFTSLSVKNFSSTDINLWQRCILFLREYTVHLSWRVGRCDKGDAKLHTLFHKPSCLSITLYSIYTCITLSSICINTLLPFPKALQVSYNIENSATNISSPYFGFCILISEPYTPWLNIDTLLVADQNWTPFYSLSTQFWYTQKSISNTLWYTKSVSNNDWW